MFFLVGSAVTAHCAVSCSISASLELWGMRGTVWYVFEMQLDYNDNNDSIGSAAMCVELCVLCPVS